MQKQQWVAADMLQQGKCLMTNQHQLAEGLVMCKSSSYKQAADSVSKCQEWTAGALVA